MSRSEIIGGTAEFGFTRFGADVVRLAEPLTGTTPNAAAPRARSLARHRAVTVTIEGRIVTGRVQRAEQASVARLEFAPMAPSTATALIAAMGDATEPDDAVYAQLPGSALTPGLAAADCSCRGRGERCLHILATLYALATVIDHEPRTVLGLYDITATTASTDAAPRWVSLGSLDVADYDRVR